MPTRRKNPRRYCGELFCNSYSELCFELESLRAYIYIDRYMLWVMRCCSKHRRNHRLTVWCVKWPLRNIRVFCYVFSDVVVASMQVEYMRL